MHALATHLFGHHQKQTEDVFIIFDPHLIINKCKQQESFQPQEFITLITTIIVLIDSQEQCDSYTYPQNSSIETSPHKTVNYDPSKPPHPPLPRVQAYFHKLVATHSSHYGHTYRNAYLLCHLSSQNYEEPYMHK
jgi:hypothetical protein